MSEQTKSTLKGYFNTGDEPTESQFSDLIDSFGLQSEVDANTAKTGITTDQANAIVANTAKVTYDDASQVSSNTSDISTLQGEQTTQDAAIALNTAKVSYTDAAQVSTNTSDISTIQGEQTTQDAAIALNTAKVSATGNELEATDINTLSKVNTIITDATLIDTGDSRLSDARIPTAHTHTESEITDLQAYLLNINSESVADLSDVVSATNTNRFVLVANGTTGYVGRALTEADISDLQSYLLSADIADFETTTELNARDTNNRDRANHTGTQTASTISDFDTEVSNNSSVAANTAKHTITFFQAQDDGTTGQTTTATASDLKGMWDTPTLTSANLSWNGTTGVLEVDTDGVVQFDIQVCGVQTASNRQQLHVELHQDTGGGYSKIVSSSNYTSRNTTQDTGASWITGYKVSASDGDLFKIMVKDVGVNSSIGTGTAAGETFISVTHYA